MASLHSLVDNLKFLNRCHQKEGVTSKPHYLIGLVCVVKTINLIMKYVYSICKYLNRSQLYMHYLDTFEVLNIMGRLKPPPPT